MLTKCPKCGKAEHVTCLNMGKRALAATLSTAVGAGGKILFRRTNPTIMKEVYKSICPERRYYCSKCKHEFSERTY